MESINIPNEFERFGSSIKEKFERDGYTEGLEKEVDDWHRGRWNEYYGPVGTKAERIKLEIEYAKLLVLIGKIRKAWDILDDAETQAYQDDLINLKEEIYSLMDQCVEKDKNE